MLIVPVLFGRSPSFALGVLGVVAGLLLVGIARPVAVEAGRPPSRGEEALATPSEGGGVIVLGPVPIFFGSWRDAPAWARWAAAAVGIAVVAAALALFVRAL